MATRSTTASQGAVSPDPTANRYRRLRRWNAVMAVLHTVQALAMLAIADPVRWQLTQTRYGITEATQTIAPVAVPWIEIPLPYLVVGFLFVSGLAHAYVSTLGYERYVTYLDRGMNPYRWYEYAVSASLMIVVIGLLAGIWDLGTLTALFGLVAVMNLTGLLMEQRNEGREQIDWTPYIVGVVAGIVPWVVIGITLASSVLASGGSVPDFVIYIFVSIFVFFNCFAVNMILQYRQVGPWSSYLFGERVYILLSLVAKSALAWQVFAGALTTPI